MLGRLWAKTRGLLSAPITRTGLQLQRCRVNSNEVDVAEFGADVVPELGDIAQLGDEPDLKAAVDSLSQAAISTWVPPADDSLLFLEGTLEGSKDKQLFILPAREYVLVPPDSNRPATGRSVDPTRGPALWMNAAAHAAVHFVNAGSNSGFMIDVAGTRNGKGDPSILLAQNLQRLRAQFGITSIEHALISHLHSDHAGALVWMVANGAITGTNVWVLPGIETAVVGPLAGQVRALDGARFPAGWQPRALTTRQLTGPTGVAVTRSTFQVGTTTVEMAVDTSHLQAFVAALVDRDWKTASGLADAATPVMRVRWDNGLDAVITGDIRGRTIEDLYQAMGDQAFRDLVGGARTWIGAHHIGAIENLKAGRGFLRLIEAMGGGTQPITLLAQVGPDHEVNRQYIRVANQSGVRVVVVGVPDPANPNATITLRSGGSAVQVGGQEFGIDPVVRAAQRRLERLQNAASTLERLGEYRGVEGATKQEVLDGIKAEAARLDQLLRDRATIAHADAHLENFRPETSEQLSTNAAGLGRVAGMEQRAPDAVLKLSRAPKEINELEREQRLARSSGETSERLRLLYAQADPTIARDIMVDELGKAKNRSTMRRAWRTIEQRLETQVETQKMMEPTNFGTRAKGVAWFGLALQAFELATPGIEQYLQSRSDQKHEDFYMFYRDAVWWNEKGLRPPIQGTSADGLVKDLGPSVERRLYDDTPGAQRGEMSAEMKAASPLKTLWVPELSQWDAAVRIAFFDSLRAWVSAHINDLEDYFAEMRTGLVAPIRPKNEGVPYGVGTWQLHVGVLTGGHVHPAWQDSAELTTIMNAAIDRARKGTDTAAEHRLARPRVKPTVSGRGAQSIRAVDATDRTSGAPIDTSEGIVGEVKVIANGAKIYGVRGGNAVYLGKTGDKDTGLVLLELGRQALPGYVWVAAGDSFTYYSLRQLEGWHYVRFVDIPTFYKNRDPSSRDFDKEKTPAEYMDAEQLEAWESVQAGREGYIYTAANNDDNTKTIRGRVNIFEKGSNVGANVLMRRKDIGPK